MEFVFKCVDYWGRPVFVNKNESVYIGSTDDLANKTMLEDPVEYFKDTSDNLVIFGWAGYEIDDDPAGQTVAKGKIELVKEFS